MPIAVRSNLMAFAGNSSYKGTVPLRHPSQNKERCSDLPFGQEIQDLVGILFYPTFTAVPVAPPHGNRRQARENALLHESSRNAWVSFFIHTSKQRQPISV